MSDATFTATPKDDNVEFSGFAKNAATVWFATAVNQAKDPFPNTSTPPDTPVTFKLVDGKCTVPKSAFTGFSDWLVKSWDSGGTWIDDDNHYYPDPASGAKLVVVKQSSLLELVVASLALDESTPRKDCEGALDLHTAWLKHLRDAYPSGGLSVGQNSNSYETINGITRDKDNKIVQGKSMTSCSQTMGNAFRNFGIPSAYTGDSISKALVAFPADDGKERGYLRKITPNSLPRAGDPFYLVNSETNVAGSPKDHHAIFGQKIGEAKDPPPYNVGDYSGGQAPTGTIDKPTPKETRDALFSQRTLTMKDSNIYSSGLPTGGVGEVPGGFRRVSMYTDMWKFFQEKGSEVKTSPKRGTLL